jgi:hypothetical protein
MVENAFGLSPLVLNSATAFLPHFARGMSGPFALDYTVPVGQLDFYKFVPGISEDLMSWYWSDANPAYFLISTNQGANGFMYSVEPDLSTLPGNTNRLFLGLRVSEKN